MLSSLRRAVVPWSLCIIPIAGMLWVLGPIQPPPLVSVARLATLTAVPLVVVGFVLCRWRTPREVSNGMSAVCLWCGLYPTAYTFGAAFAPRHEHAFALAYVAVGLTSGVLAARGPESQQQSLQRFFATAAAVTFLLFAALLTRTYVFPVPLPAGAQQAVDAITVDPAVASGPGPRPDIVHVVLDGMGRRDVLEREYGLDLSLPVARLEAAGFAVDDRRAHANYTQTQLTFASMFNMQYLDALAAVAAGTNDRRPLMALTAEAIVPRVLRDLGYAVEMLGSGYGSSGEFAHADRCDCPQLWFADAEFGTLSLTPFRTMLGAVGEQAHFDRSLEVLAGVERFEAGPKPTYLFAHVPMPHPPFLVNESGDFVPTDVPASGRDGSNFAGSPDQYRRGYALQARFVLTRAVAAAEASLHRAQRHGRQVIFVISGDHGPRLGFDVHRPHPSSAGMVLPVFLAMRLPGATREPLPRSLVNVYRTIFRTLGVPLENLPDRATLSGFSNPYVGPSIASDDVSDPAARSDKLSP
jgi:hypothetical protein